MSDLEALVILRHIPGLGPTKGRVLLHHFGSSEAVLSASQKHLMEVPGIGEGLARAITQASDQQSWRKDLELVQRYGVRLISHEDPSYPAGLRDLTDAPLYLYVKGSLERGDQTGIAVIGTRAASVYGRECARRLSQDLAAAKCTVVSGLARGIDTEAHQGALTTGRTIAVIGSGLANLYPQENRHLAGQITAAGSVISEFPMATAPDRQTFPQRNRLVAAMSRGCLLIEAPVKSGAMITMRRAEALKRQTFALPGRIDHENFKGNHLLLKEGRATLVESALDMLAAYDDLFSSLPKEKKAFKPQVPLEPEESQILSLLEASEISADELLQRSGLGISKLNILLMSLVIKKKVKELPGKLYARVS